MIHRVHMAWKVAKIFKAHYVSVPLHDEQSQ